MDNRFLLVMFGVLLLGSSVVLAAAGKVTITSPADGATVSASDRVVLHYAADPGPEGDHLHLNVDGKRVDVIHQLKGEADVWLYPGAHQVCLAVNTRAHVPTGVKQCINLTAK